MHTINFENLDKRYSDIGMMHPDLQWLVESILIDCDKYNLPFVLFETGRTIARQQKLLGLKRSKTLKSKHLITKDSIYSFACDFVLFYIKNDKNIYSWASTEDEKQNAIDMAHYKMLSDLVMTKYPILLKDTNIKKIISGGQWRFFKDWPHYEFVLKDL